MALPEIPVMDETCTVRDVFNQHRETAGAIADRFHTLPMRPLLRLFNRVSRNWLQKYRPPFSEDLDYIAGEMPGRSAYALNLAYEWGCTTTVSDDKNAGGVRMFRTLDWPVKGLGDKFVVARHEGAAGEYWNIAYPGFAGVLTGLAKGRFTIAINQAPLPRSKWGPVIDWLREKRSNFRSGGMPAPFLLRKVFEECATYDDAVKALMTTPLATHAIFTVAGTKSGEHCVIERRPDDAILHDKAHCAANHWLNKEWQGWPRPFNSRKRQAIMAETFAQYKGNFDWLTRPVLSVGTRMAMEANARTGRLRVIGMEGSKIVTQTLKLS